jgi:hypothetical protein
VTITYSRFIGATFVLSLDLEDHGNDSDAQPICKLFDNFCISDVSSAFFNCKNPVDLILFA